MAPTSATQRNIGFFLDKSELEDEDDFIASGDIKLIKLTTEPPMQPLLISLRTEEKTREISWDLGALVDPPTKLGSRVKSDNQHSTAIVGLLSVSLASTLYTIVCVFLAGVSFEQSNGANFLMWLLLSCASGFVAFASFSVTRKVSGAYGGNKWGLSSIANSTMRYGLK
ncbi:MAG: hypothetical protein U1E49_03380 [Hyphomicrobiaceae bacterium]